MKIGRRDIGLLAIGCMIGAIVTVLLTTTPTPPPTAPASSAVATGPVLTSASLPPRLRTVPGIHRKESSFQFQRTAHSWQDPTFYNIPWQTTPFQIVAPPRINDRLDSRSRLGPPMPRRMDLIDMRYQPDIRLDNVQ